MQEISNITYITIKFCTHNLVANIKHKNWLLQS